MTDSTNDSPDAAERRASQLLALVATRQPELSERFIALLIARARGQRAVAVPLRAFGTFVLALADAARAALYRADRGGQP
jgi:hypothetical protein